MFRRFFLGFLGLTFSLNALPSGEQVVEGQAAFMPSSDALQVNANGKAILHWEQFNIAPHESVHFIQSQSSQAILNRVTSDSVTQILGQLRANCPIYLINPHGIFIGNSACIDTAGFLASTADLSNEAFWHGAELLFQDFGDGSIVNLGALRANDGDIFLIARSIDNQGSIEALHGNVVLATHEMMLCPDTKECVFIRVDEADPEDKGIKNSGKIAALQVDLSTQSPYEKAICHTGSIEATASLEQNGRIYLVAEKGETFVDGSLTARAGEVRVLSQKILVEEHAHIDVSGSSGGNVLIGGDYQGGNPNILNAEKTLVAPGAQIHADALLQGNGGKVIVWSDQATSYKGTITACGGQENGDGGFVEVSGKQLIFDGQVRLDAPFGKIGTLLLDPTNVTISAADSGGSFSGCIAGTNTFTPDAAVTDTIAAATLVGLLNAPCNVTISTVGSAGGGTGAITVSSAVSWSAATTLTLTAASNISISAAITNTSASTGFTAMNFTANGTGAVANPGILLNTVGGNLTTTGGDVILSGTSDTVITASHGVSISGGKIATTNGNITVTGTVPVGATGANIFGVNMNTISGLTSSSGNITVSGTSNTTGDSGFGVQLAQTWASGTTGILTFSNCHGGSGTASHGININLGATFTGSGNVIFSSCVGGNNATTGGDGINVAAAFTTTGSITATSSITGQGAGGVGFASSANFSTTGASHPIAITATATGTTGACHGISLTGGSMSTNAGDSITLNGTGGSSTTASHGISLTGGNSTVSTTTGNGNISLIGTASGAAASIGVRIAGSAVGVINSTSGTITISGTSTATVAGSHGAALATAWTPVTTGLITFTNCTGGGTGASHAVNLGGTFTGSSAVTFSSCLGGTGGGNGINATAAFTTTGAVTATSSITGQGNGGVGFASSANFSTTGALSPISITASATGITGACHGISITGGTFTTSGGGALSLTGTAGPGAAAAGVSLTAGTVSTTNNGNLSITGNGAGTANASNGVNISTTVSVAGTGTLTINGTASAAAASSIGISVTGGTTSTASGMMMLTAQGGGTGNSNIGLSYTGGTVTTVDGGITVASAIGSTGAGTGNVGVNLVGNPRSLTATGAGNISINSAIGSTNAASSGGIGISETNRFSITTVGGSITINATGSTVSTGSGNIGFNIAGGNAGAPGSITSSGGGNIGITVLGSGGVGSGNNNIGMQLNVVNNSFSISTAGAFTITAAGTTNGGAGSTGNIGLSIVAGAALTTSGPNPLSITARGDQNGASSNATALSIGIVSSIQATGTGSIIFDLVGASTSTAGGHKGLSINSPLDGVLTAGGAITINATGGALSTGSGNIGLSMTGGNAGTTGGIRSSAGGNIGIIAVGSGGVGSGSSNIGMQLNVTNNSAIISTSGALTITTTGVTNGGVGSTGNIGLSLVSSAGLITSGPNPLSITARGDQNGASSNATALSIGIVSSIQATGTGSIIFDLVGASTSTAGGHTGLSINSPLDGVLTAGGAITINATGGALSTGSGNIGLSMTGGNAGTAGGIRSSGGGNIGITAVGSGGVGSGSSNIGMRLNVTNNTVPISTSGALTITTTGVTNGGVGSTGNIGLSIVAGAALTTSGPSPFSITARGDQNGASSNAIALSFTNGIIQATGSGLIALDLQGAPNSTAGGNIGFSATLTSAIRSVDGSITMNASSGGQGVGNQGISMTSSSSISSTSGAISVTGTGGTVSGNTNQGIFLNTDAGITSTSGIVTLIGNGGFGSNGIHISAGAVSSGNTGTVTCTGIGGDGIGGYGIFLTGVNSLIQTLDGSISLTGNGAGTGANAEGIGVFAAAKIQATGTGPVTLAGTASATGGNSSRGIVVNGGSSIVSSTSGTMTLNGNGGGTGLSSSGLEVSGGGKISSTSGLITGTLLGAAGTSGCTGIFATGVGSLITTATGSGINLTGIGGGTTTSNQGISLAAAGGITTTSNAPITLVGTGSASGTSSNEGIFMTGASTEVSTVTGAIQMTGTAGAGTTNGITVDTSATVVSSTAGLITMNSTNNNVAVQNNSSVKTQGIGGPGVNDISVTSQGVSVTGGASGSAVISTVNGNIGLASTGPVVVTGSTVLNSFGQITVGNAANTVTIQTTTLSLTAGSGSGALAEISTVGGLLSIDGSGAITLTGGSNTNTQAQIITRTAVLTTATDAIRIGQVSLTKPTSITLLGNTGATSQALIASDQGGNIVSTITGLYTITGGTGTTDARAGVYAGFTGGTSAGSGNINLTGSGFLLTGGASGAGTKLAEIVTPSGGGSVTLSSSGGNVTLQAGGSTTANGSNANIEAKAVNSTVNLLGSGIVTLNGGSTANQHSYIRTTAASGVNPISFTCNALTINGSTNVAGTNSSSELLTSFGSLAVTCNGIISLTGGAAAGATARIAVNAGDTTDTVSINMQELNIKGSTSTATLAEIASLGGIISVDWTSVGSGAVLLQSNAADAFIRTTTNVLTTANDAIRIGQTTPPTSITLTGGTGATARALIISDQGGNIVSTITGLYTITGGTGTTDARAGIYAGFTGGTSAGSGNITLTGTNYVLTGGASGTGYNSAEILAPTGGGLITINSNGSPLSLHAGAATTSDARIESLASGNLIISNISTFTASGSSGTSARAIVATGLGGDIAVTGTGNYIINGGTSGSDSRAGFYAGLAAGSGNINLTGAGFSLTGGASGAGYNSAEILAPTGGGLITIHANGSPLSLNAGAATTSDARIESLASGNLIISNISTFTASGNSGTTARAIVATGLGGDITVTGTGNYTITGGTSGTDSRAGFYAGLAAGSGNINLTGAGFSLTGGASGAGYNSAEILAPAAGGVISITSNGSPMSLQAGGATTSDARIESLASGSLNISTISTFKASGSSGSSSRAIVATGQGGDINVTGLGNYSITGGTSIVDSRAGFYAGLAGGSGNINLTGTGFSLTGGASGAGYNSAEILTPIGGGGITLTSGATLIQLQGGGGSTSDARIITVGTGNINITGSSAFSAVGGSGASSVADVNAQGTLTSNIGTGIYTLTGGSGTSSLARFTATGAVNLNGHDYNLTAGNSAAADGSNAIIQSTGMNTTLTLTSNNGGAITLNGGTAADQHSYIQTTAGSGTNPIAITCGSLSLNGSMTGGASQASAEIKTILGNIQIGASGNVTLAGGSAMNTDALIHSTTQGALTVNAQNLNIQGGTGVGTSGIVTQAGDISIICSQNAQCAAPNAGAIVAIQTFGSDLTMTVGGSIDLSGFTTLSTPAPTGNLLLIAGQNISVGTSAQIIDNGTVNSTLTLVVDNAFPTAPGVGSGQFILDAGGTISAGAGTPVKIYTARRPQNTILAPINGMPYVPGPFAVDTPTEQWGIYYPGGVYGGLAFTIYYKEPQPIPPGPPINPQHQILNNIAANIVQLSDLLPVFLPVLDVSRGHYHFQICDKVNGFECAPTFSPYGSFIFQDDVYWIGTDF